MTRARDLSEILNSTGLSVDTDTLVVDSANNRVGIGTNSPGVELDVEGGANVFEIARFGVSTNNNSQITIGYFDANATNGLPVVIDASDFGGLIQGGDNGHLVLGIRDNDATDALDIVSGGGNFMTDTTYDTLVATFKANGNVGIGTTQPASLLHVQSNDATTNTFVDMLTLTALSTGTTTTGFGPAIKFQAERNNGVMQNVGRIRSVAEINSGTDISSGLAFETSTVGVADEKVRISYDGKVGIGTTDPSSYLGSTGLVIKNDTRPELSMVSTNTALETNSHQIRFFNADAPSDYEIAQIAVGIAEGQKNRGTFDFLVNNGSALTSALHINRLGSVGIGTSSVESTLHLQSASAGGRGATLTIDNNAASTVGNESQITFLTDAGASVAGIANARIKAISTNAGDGRAALTFTTWNGSAEDERMRIDSSGNVSIGVFTGTEPTWFGNSDLILNDNTFAFQGKNYDESVFNTSVDAPYTYLTHNGYWNSGWQQHKDGVPVSQLMIGSGSLQFRNAPDAGGTDVPAAGLATKFTIDASGNLLVGKTVNDLTTDGIVLRSTGELFATRANDVAAFNRSSADGNIVTFRIADLPKGVIGTTTSAGGSRFAIGGAGDPGIIFGGTGVFPAGEITASDAVSDLGSGSYRWQDLHLSGGVVLDENPTIVSTTVAARTIGSKTLDDYEEGTWTTTFGALVNLTGTPVLTEARYTKIGNLVSLSGKITGTTVTSAGVYTSIILDLPFLMDAITSIAVGSSWFGDLQQGGIVAANTGANADEIFVALPPFGWTGNGNVDISFTFTYQSA